jgi:hypothetical protein
MDSLLGKSSLNGERYYERDIRSQYEPITPNTQWDHGAGHICVGIVWQGKKMAFRYSGGAVAACKT